MESSAEGQQSERRATIEAGRQHPSTAPAAGFRSADLICTLPPVG
jgi:hypothetical protein